MRTISGTLEAAQEAASNNPYIHLVFTSKDGGTTHDYSSDQRGRRILLIDHQEEAYNDYATLIIRDNDRIVPNLKGYWTEIGYGCVTGAGNEYSTTPRLWVKHQQHISAGGRVHVVLELEGMWARAGEMPIRLGDPPLYTQEYTSDTVYSIISAIMAEIDYTLNALVQNDGIINSLQPQFGINAQPFEYAAGIIYRLIGMTKSYLRTKASKQFEVIYPQESDADALTYYSDQAFHFYEYMERKNVLIPNHVICYGNAGEDGLWTSYITGEALDQAEIDSYEDVIQLAMAGELTRQTDVDNRAAVVLARAEAEKLAGRMVAPHDCRVELYDRIAVIDRRAL